MARVLFLTESFHPVLGGGETHIRRVGAHLAARGEQPLVLTRRTGADWSASGEVDGIRIERVDPPGPGRAGKYRMVPAALAALSRLQHAFDLLVVRGTRILGLPGLLAARALGKPVVLQPEVNGELSGEVYTWGTGLAGTAAGSAVHAATRLRNHLLVDADAFVAMSRAIVAEMEAAGVPAARIAYLPHGVDVQRFRPATAEERRALRGRLGLPREALVITYTGRLLRGKGLETLLEAFLRLSAPHARLALVGAGGGQPLSIEDELRRRAADPACGGRVLLPGRVEEVEAWLRASDVFAFPSEFEALGLSLLEAAACALPCVGSRTGGIVDVIEPERSGLLVAPGEVGELAETLQRLVADPGLRQRLGARGRQVVEARFDLRDNLDRYLTLFAELMSPRIRSARLR